MRLPRAVAVRLVGAAGGPVVTVTVALPTIAFRVAVTVPDPAVEPAVNVVLAPAAGETDDPGTDVAHAAPETSTGLPYASVPVAVNGWVPPAARVALPGVTVIEATTAADTV